MQQKYVLNWHARQTTMWWSKDLKIETVALTQHLLLKVDLYCQRGYKRQLLQPLCRWMLYTVAGEASECCCRGDILQNWSLSDIHKTWCTEINRVTQISLSWLGKKYHNNFTLISDRNKILFFKLLDWHVLIWSILWGLFYGTWALRN